jgi:hypothetical protein
MTQEQHNFWNNWDFKTILVILQLIGVIWLVATTYTKLEAKVEAHRALVNLEIEDMREDVMQIKIQINEIHTLLIKQKYDR